MNKRMTMGVLSGAMVLAAAAWAAGQTAEPAQATAPKAPPKAVGPRLPRGGLMGGLMNLDENALAVLDPGALLEAATDLPKGKELAAMYRAEAGAAELDLQTLRQNLVNELLEAMRGGADEAKTREIVDHGRAEVLFAETKLTEARIRYAEQLLKAAKEDPKGVAERETDSVMNMINQMRAFGRTFRAGGGPPGLPGVKMPPTEAPAEPPAGK